MVWIHGGGNFAGSAADLVPTTQQLWYDGQFFASKRGVVVVTVNYRLGPFGFFAHPELASEHSPLGNQGLLDQRMVFQWVRDNIAAFGGDKENVTIFGESAGSADVCYHVASPGRRGPLPPRDQRERRLHRLDQRRQGPDRRAGRHRDRGLREGHGLRHGDRRSSRVCAASRSATSWPTRMQPDPMSLTAPAPAVELRPGGRRRGRLPARSGANALRQRAGQQVPYILGSNNDEGKLFTSRRRDDHVAGRLPCRRWGQRFPNIGDQVAAEYPASNFGGDYNAALSRAIGDSGLGCGTHDTARRAAKAGLKVFMYNFNMPWGIDARLLGASHASEISHVFGDP